MNKKDFTHGVLLFLFIQSILMIVIFCLDNTTITTTNGLYKSLNIKAWQSLSSFPTDNGGYLYAPLMALLTKLIPDWAVNFYGNISPFLIWRKMVLVHSVFGAASSAVIFLLSRCLNNKTTLSILIALAHAVFSFVLINSINTEDIMPGYFFFVFGFYMFILGIQNPLKHRIFFTLTTLSTVSTIFLHWTLFPPAALSYTVLLLFLMKKDTKYIRIGLEQICLFLGILIFASLIGRLLQSLLNVGTPPTFWGLLLPSKAGGSWTGFFWQKLECLYLGMGRYFFSRVNDNVFPSTLIERFSITLGWFLILGSILTMVRIVLHKYSHQLTLVALFGISILFFGELQNLYGSPQDPQFQLQPMLITTLAFICFANLKIPDKIKAFFLCFIIFLCLSFNVNNLFKLRNQDSFLVSATKEMDLRFPGNQVQVVQTSYESFSIYLMLFRKQSWDTYLSEVVSLNTPLNKGMTTASAIIDFFERRIDDALRSKKKIVIKSPWIDPDYIYSLQQQKLPKEECEKLALYLLKNYSVVKQHTLMWGTFVEIERKQ